MQMEPLDESRMIYQNLEKEGFKGFDPYDALNSPLLNHIPGRLSKIALTQLLVYSPINIRKVIGIKREVNPKTMGLVLSALCLLTSKSKSPMEYKRSIDWIIEWLKKNQNNDYSGPCWGYHFPWQDLHKYIPRYEPSIVVTSIIGNSLLDHYKNYPDPHNLEFIRKIGDFIMNDLNRFTDSDGICFSYSPHDNNVVHNANALGAGFLLRLSQATGDSNLEKVAWSSIRFTLKKQNPDGSWFYSIDPTKGTQRTQFDFHQGFILDVIRLFWERNGKREFFDSMEKGLDFYVKLLDRNGRAFFRYPRKWPIDIHNQAQMIITLSDYSSIFPHYKDYYLKALGYLRNNMINEDFQTYHQIWPFFKNRNNYPRWGDAWALLALSKSIVGEIS